MGNAAIQGLLFIPSRMNSQLEHLAVTGPCLVLLSHIFQSFFIENKRKLSVEETLSHFPHLLSKGMNWPQNAL